ncbi:hypothetical protein ACFE04_015845 [Oxalis oulophora]
MARRALGRPMDSTLGAGKLNKSEVELKKCSDKLDTVEPKTAANGLVPITPPSNVAMRPISVSSVEFNVESNGDCMSPQTPKDSVFDPFAAGLDDKAWAPMCNKYAEEIRCHVNRCLNFGSSVKPLKYDSDDINYSEDEMVEFLYADLLEVIVTKQAEFFLAELKSAVTFQTPASAPRTIGTAETCPGAPMKSSGRSRKVDVVGLCKKLEF